ncbi:MAG: EAL domain-containing protein [Rhizobiaceae bacterium]|nr:EAL domain-containing protein [Rhizobiaceae bacterium]
MQRALMTVAAALLVCGAGYLLLGFFVDNGAHPEKLVLFTAAITLVLAALAAAFSARALLRASALRAEMARLTRSVDMAVAALTARGDRDASEVRALKDRVAEEVSRLSAGHAPAAGEAARTNVVMLPARRRFRPEIVASQGAAGVEPTGTEIVPAIEEIMRAGPPRIGLRRIVSVARAEATGYDVLARVMPAGGPPEDIDRLPETAGDEASAAFSRWLLAGAVDAAHRSLADEPRALPFHVSLCEALLDDGRELAGAVDLLASAPEIATQIVLVVPGSILQSKGGDHDDALGLLARTGVRFAAEGWDGTAEGFLGLQARGIASVRVSCDALLRMRDDPASSASPVAMIEMAALAGMPLVATGVATDRDTIAVIDLGVAQMTGSRFARPLPPAQRRRRSGTGI